MVERPDDRLAREHLPGTRRVGDPRREVHGPPEQIEVPLDHGAGVHARVRAGRARLIHRGHEAERGRQAALGIGQPQHRAVAQQLHESPAVLGRDRMGPLLERGGGTHRDPVAALLRELGEAGEIDEHHRRRRLRLRHRREVLQRQEALEALDDPLDAPTLEIASAQPREQLRREVGCRRVLAPHLVREHLDLSADQPFASRLTELLVDELDPSEGRDAGALGEQARRPEHRFVVRRGTPHVEEPPEHLLLVDMDRRVRVGRRLSHRLEHRRQPFRHRSRVGDEGSERAGGSGAGLVGEVLPGELHVQPALVHRPDEHVLGQAGVEQCRGHLHAEHVRPDERRRTVGTQDADVGQPLHPVLGHARLVGELLRGEGSRHGHSLVTPSLWHPDEP